LRHRDFTVGATLQDRGPLADSGDDPGFLTKPQGRGRIPEFFLSPRTAPIEARMEKARRFPPHRSGKRRDSLDPGRSMPRTSPAHFSCDADPGRRVEKFASRISRLISLPSLLIEIALVRCKDFLDE
jgi:hypothetical protein